MTRLIAFSFQAPSKTAKVTNARNGETKLGQTIVHLSSFQAINESPVSFVLFGIAEDIGVRANFGKPGTALAWGHFLTAFFNQQSNQFINGDQLGILGNFTTTATESEVATSKPEALGTIVSALDKEVSVLVRLILDAGKTPIIIGGGHNNSYGNLRGLSLHKQAKVNCLNIDAHTDLRSLDYRHSGNGFSYAIHHRILAKYAVLGVQERYTPQYIYEKLSSDYKSCKFWHFYHASNHEQDLKNALSYVCDESFGLEIDCDAIAGFPASAQSPSGYTVDQIRSTISRVSQEINCKYLHLCEAAPLENDTITAKALAFFVSDFIRHHHANHTF